MTIDINNYPGLEDSIILCKDNFAIIDNWNQVTDIESITGQKIDVLFPNDNWGFSDEYTMCDNCYNHTHTNEYVILDDSNIICKNCIPEFKEDYIESLCNNHKSANKFLSQKELIDLGYSLFLPEKYQSGIRDSNIDDPQIIMQNAIKAHPNSNFIFHINSVNMFEVNYTLYEKKDN